MDLCADEFGRLGTEESAKRSAKSGKRIWYLPGPCICQFTIDGVNDSSEQNTGLQANIQEHGRSILVYRCVEHLGETDG